MEFCPKCGAMMLPNDGILKCKTCGYSNELEKNDMYEASKEITNETCPECGNDKATYKLLQTRSADEAPTRIFTCTKCKHTWRAYD